MKKSSARPTAAPAKRRPKNTTWLWLLLFVAFLTGVAIWWYLTQGPKILPTPTFSEETQAWERTQEEKNLVFGGIPKPLQSRNEVTVLRNIGFVQGYSEEWRNPLWVSYRIDQAGSATAPKRPPRFTVDHRTKARINHDSYKNSGYDRGHLAPNFAIASRFGIDAQKETFFMSNIVPQKPDLNRKIWEKLERLEVEYSNRYGKVWTMTGPLFDQDRETMPTGIEIPDAFFKIILDEDERTKDLRFLAFVIPQEVRGTEPLNSFLSSIDEIERQSGFDFFWALTDPREEYLEKLTPRVLWQ